MGAGRLRRIRFFSYITCVLQPHTDFGRLHDCLWNEKHRAQVKAGVPEGGSASDDFPWLSTLSVTLVPLLLAGPAFAYNRVDGEEVLKNVAGGAYAILVCIFFVRLLRRRAKSGTTEVCFSSICLSRNDPSG